MSWKHSAQSQLAPATSMCQWMPIQRSPSPQLSKTSWCPPQLLAVAVLTVYVMQDQVRLKRPELNTHSGTQWGLWLAQFDTPNDQLCALKLLSHLQILDLHQVPAPLSSTARRPCICGQVRSAVRAMHTWLISHENVDIATTAFTSFAYGKSGGLVQYFYRTSNLLHYSQNIPFNSIADPKTGWLFSA